MPVRIDITADRLAPVLPLALLRDVERQHADEPLMERAGAAAADIAAAMLAHKRGPVVVLAGPGNNGGDAGVCARHLHARGFDVAVAWSADPARLAPEAAAAFAGASTAGVRFEPAPPSRRPALVVDGLFGIGLSRPVAAPYDGWIEWANAQSAPVLALDVPSGLDAATGIAHRPTIAAAATATFIALKPGLLTGDGPDHCGEVSVHDLGLDVAGVATGVRLEWRPLARDLPAILARRKRKTHKGTFGRACVVGGTEALVGAALLAGRAAIRLGAGRVVVGLAARNPPLVDWGSAELMLRDAASVGDDYDAWVVGPGLGTDERAHALVAKAARVAQPLVLGCGKSRVRRECPPVDRAFEAFRQGWYVGTEVCSPRRRPHWPTQRTTALGGQLGRRDPALRAVSDVPDDLDLPVEARKRQTARLGFDRVARRAAEARPELDPHGMPRASPGAADLALDEERARPDAGRPESPPLILSGEEELPLGPVEQEVGVAARQQTRGRGGGLDGAHGRLVVREQPLVPERRSDRSQLSCERCERSGRCPPRSGACDWHSGSWGSAAPAWSWIGRSPPHAGPGFRRSPPATGAA